MKEFDIIWWLIVGSIFLLRVRYFFDDGVRWGYFGFEGDIFLVFGFYFNSKLFKLFMLDWYIVRDMKKYLICIYVFVYIYIF